MSELLREKGNEKVVQIRGTLSDTRKRERERETETEREGEEANV